MIHKRVILLALVLLVLSFGSSFVDAATASSPNSQATATYTTSKQSVPLPVRNKPKPGPQPNQVVTDNCNGYLDTNSTGTYVNYAGEIVCNDVAVTLTVTLYVQVYNNYSQSFDTVTNRQESCNYCTRVIAPVYGGYYQYYPSSGQLVRVLGIFYAQGSASSAENFIISPQYQF